MVLFVWLFGFAVFVCCCFSCSPVSVFGFSPCGMTSYDATPRVEAITALASLAVISTASKHLHNDLARAIMALEQKKTLSHRSISIV